MDQIWLFVSNAGLTATHVLAVAVGLGVFAVVFGLAGVTTSGPTPRQRRIRAMAAPAPDRTVVTLDDNDPTGALRQLLPFVGQDRGRIARLLRQAGIHRAHAVRVFFLVRSILSAALPSLFILAAWTGPRMPDPIRELLGPLTEVSNVHILQVGIALAALGFFGPALWLRQRVADRKLKIWRGLPNALDLLRISVEAGLGFDAAVLRVARELKDVCPPIAEEFTVLLLEIRAGKPRERALHDLATRTGVEEISAFGSVVLQSAEFGTPLTDALSTFAQDMRYNREMMAQEKANKLPVKMSGVLAAFMMPILLVVAAGPVILRMGEMFSGR